MNTANTFGLDGRFGSQDRPPAPAWRWGEVEDLAPAAVFLASETGRFVDGHILYLDGGLPASF